MVDRINRIHKIRQEPFRPLALGPYLIPGPYLNLVNSINPVVVLLRDRQAEGGHLVIIADQRDVADKHRMVPRLALEHLETRELGELIRRRLYQHQLALL